MIYSITILGGSDKDGKPENVREMEIKSGEILAVVGPTGSGKTQLISDIEQYKEDETLTGRQILINNQSYNAYEDKKNLRYLIAQVSQNMNFVIDMTIEEFLLMHAKLRNILSYETKIREVLAITNQLSGEPVSLNTNLTQLSGGQSRALMVADVALISDAPIVLIDEIENAGIDRIRALETLTGQGKIVLVVSHDPVLMLMSEKRVVMKNGGMDKICNRTTEEIIVLESLIKSEYKISRFRDELRNGKNIIN